MKFHTYAAFLLVSVVTNVDSLILNPTKPERFPPIKPEDLPAEQKPLYDELEDLRVKLFGDYFILKQGDGSFAGPFETAYEAPYAFRGFLDVAVQLGKYPELPKDARETAILVVGSHYNSWYEIYAHERLAKLQGLTWRQIDLIKTGRKPQGQDALSKNCSVAYGVAEASLTGSSLKGRLSDKMWNKSVDAFGKRGALILSHYIGYYTYACISMNAVGVGLPQGESIKTPEV